MGGANWPPSSYDPETHLLYVCATDRINTFSVQESLRAARGESGRTWAGGSRRPHGRRSRHLRGARRHDEQARVAAAVARDLLQRLRRHGRRPAVRRPQRRAAHGARQANGQLLWEFMTDAGVNTTVTTFEWNGEQCVVVHAGGGVFAGAKRGDGIWMFSLDGTMESLPVTAAAPGGGGGGCGGPGVRRPRRRIARSTSRTASSFTPKRASPVTARRRRRPRRRADARRRLAARDDPRGVASRPQHDAGLRPRLHRGRSARRRCATSSTCSPSSRLRVAQIGRRRH